MPIFKFDTAIGVARNVKAFLRLEGGVTRGKVPEDRQDKLARELGSARQRVRDQRRLLNERDGEIARLKKELWTTRASTQQGSQKDASKQSDADIVSPQGGLPDFIIIGAQKCGTTSLYNLVYRHPDVRRAARKEVHYFDENFDKGIEWYRSQFPLFAQENGRRTITGEASPLYMFHPRVPERAAKVVPQAKLIAMLRNPVDRAFSGYHHAAKVGRKHKKSFEELVEEEITRGKRTLLARGIYVDQLRRWHKFFDREQLLVLKSEEFFENPDSTLGRVLDFLELPGWVPDTTPVANKGVYTEQMNPETRERLNEYFEPHNRRLYEYLGVDFGW